MRIVSKLLFLMLVYQSVAQDVNNLKQTLEGLDTLLQKDYTNYFFEISDRYSLTNNREIYYDFFRDIERSKRLKNDEAYKNHYYLFKARLHKIAKEYDKSFVALNTITENLATFSKKDSLSYYILYHVNLMEIGLYQQSISYYKKIDQIKNKPSSRRSDWAPDVFWLVGEDFSYNRMGDYKNAIRVAKKTYSQYKVDFPTDIYFLFNRANNVGVFYNNDKQADSALVYFKEALKYLNAPDFPKSEKFLQYKALVQGNIAQSHMIKGDYDKAIPLLREDVNMSKINDPSNATYSALLMAECYVALKDEKNTQKSLSTFYDISRLTDAKINSKNQQKLRRIKADLFKIQGNEKEALKLLEEQLRFRDSMDAFNTAERSLALQAAFEFEKKEVELQNSKQKEKELTVNIIRKNTGIIIGVFIIVILALIILFYIINIKKERGITKKFKELNSTIEDNGYIIEKALNEKETLLKEIHHRVKNNMQVVSSLLSIQSNSITNEAARMALLDGQARVKSMALVHQKLYETENFKDINFSNYTEQLIIHLISSYAINCDVNYKINSKESIDIDVAVPLGLILNEIVTNSIKYCKNDQELKLNVDFKLNENIYELKVSDNSLGFDFEKIKSKNTLGLRLIEILVKQLEGQLTIDTSEDKPTSYIITLPKPTVL